MLAMSYDDFKFLRFIDFKDFNSWSVKYLTDTDFNYNNQFDLVSISSFLERDKTPVDIEDEKNYKRVTIKINNGGVFLRDIEIGKNIGTKKQFQIKSGQFLLSKIDARNGAFGVVTDSVDKAIITGNFWTYNVDYKKVLPSFLSLITTTNKFMEFCQKNSAGTTNRHYLQEDKFLSQKIPLPSLDEQQALVSAYQAKISQAEQLEQQAKQLEQDIEEYIFSELNINFSINNSKIIGKLKFIEFKNLTTWVYNENEESFFSELNKTKYPLISLGSAFEFVTRTWKKNTPTVQYIEIGSVHEKLGILETKEISSENAPSRATQIVNTGDLIIGTTRPYLKKFVIIEEYFNNFVASSGFAVIKDNQARYNLYFLNEVLKTQIGIKQFEIKMTGALYPAITQSELMDIKIPLPNIEIQNRIATEIKLKKEVQRKNIEDAFQLRQQAIQDFETAIFV